MDVNSHKNKGQNAAFSAPDNITPFPSHLRTKREAIADAISSAGITAGVTGGLFSSTRLAAQIKPKAIEWLWKGWIPANCVGAITGDPKAGKSTFLRALVAALSTGSALPGDTATRQPLNVWWLTAEEDAASQIVPSLMLHNADLNRIHVQDIRVDLGTKAARLSLRKFIHDNAIGFVVIDSLSSWASGIDLNSPSAGAGWIQPFKELAAEEGCTVIIVRHRKKGSGKGPSAEAAMGSQTIQAVLRFELTVTVKEGTDERTLLRTAGNLGKEPEGLAATLEGDGDLPRWRWLDRAPAAPTAPTGPKLSKTQAKTLALLPTTGEGISRFELRRLFMDAKFSDATKESQLKTFNRTLEELAKKGLISVSPEDFISKNQQFTT